MEQKGKEWSGDRGDCEDKDEGRRLRGERRKTKEGKLRCRSKDVYTNDESKDGRRIVEASRRTVERVSRDCRRVP